MQQLLHSLGTTTLHYLSLYYLLLVAAFLITILLPFLLFPPQLIYDSLYVDSPDLADFFFRAPWPLFLIGITLFAFLWPITLLASCLYELIRRPK